MAKRDKNKKALKMSSFRPHVNPLASTEEKMTDEYGLKMGKLIENEWFYIGGGNTYSDYFDKRLKFDRLRRYARGEHSTDLHKKLITDGTDGESYTNYDFRPIQVLPKFIKLVVNQMLERLYEIDAQAVDGISQGLRDSYKEILEKNMLAKPMLEDAKNLLNIDLMPSNTEVPETSEELDLHMKLNYKPAIEIAIEESLKYTLELNEYDETQRQLLKDLTEIGVSCVYHKTDPVKGIIIERRDPADMVWSYATNSNFKNVYYYGYAERMTINELQRISGKKFSDEEVLDFKNVSNEWQAYNRISDQFWYRGEDLASHMVDVLHFTFKTTKNRKFKKKYRKDGSYRITEKPSTFMKPDSVKEQEDKQGYKDFDVLEEVIDVWYEGSMVLGTNYIFNYKECSNMIRPEGFLNTNVMSNYIMYAPEMYQGRIQSLVSRVINDVDALQQIKTKIQQFIAKARPNGIYIDIDGLQEVDLGGSDTMSPLELIRFYNDTGNLIGTSRMADGSIQNGRSIQELNNGQIAGLEQLMNSYNFYFNLLRDSIGIGQGADGSLPHPDTSNGALQQQQITSNVATRYVLEGQLKMTQYLCNGLSLRLKDIFKFSNLKKAYINSIGKINVDVLNSIKKLHLHDFGISIKLKPDSQEKALLEGNLQAEIASGGISTTDAIDIRKIGNLALANQMLKIRKEKHLKEQHERELEKIKSQSEGNAQAAQAASQSKQQEISLEMEAKKEIEAIRGNNDIARIERELAAKKELMELEYYYQTGQKLEIEKAKKEAEVYKEDRRDKRQAQSATQQSEIKSENSKENPKPIDFNSSHSSITGELGLDDFRV